MNQSEFDEQLFPIKNVIDTDELQTLANQKLDEIMHKYSSIEEFEDLQARMNKTKSEIEAISQIRKLYILKVAQESSFKNKFEFKLSYAIARYQRKNVRTIDDDARIEFLPSIMRIFCKQWIAS